MLNSFIRRLLTGLPVLLTLSACSAYVETYGYGWVKESPLPAEMVTEVHLPEGAPSISQRFRPEELSLDGGHMGFDIVVPSRTPVLAVTDGEVASIELSFLYGKQVMVNHGRTAAGFRVQSRYFHLSEQLVMPGEKVSRGQLLGFTGATGMAAGFFPHLHFEVYRLNKGTPPFAVKNIDPQKFWVDGVGMITCFDLNHEFPFDQAAFTYPVPCKDIAWR